MQVTLSCPCGALQVAPGVLGNFPFYCSYSLLCFSEWVLAFTIAVWCSEPLWCLSWKHKGEAQEETFWNKQVQKQTSGTALLPTWEKEGVMPMGRWALCSVPNRVSFVQTFFLVIYVCMALIDNILSFEGITVGLKEVKGMKMLVLSRLRDTVKQHCC